MSMNNKTSEHQLASMLLQQAFEDFGKSTTRLQEAFIDLQRKFENIDRELEYKNQELKKALAEKDKAKHYLQNILESLTTGIVVVDMQGKVAMMNRCAELFTGVSYKDVKGKGAELLFEDKFLCDSKGHFDLQCLTGGLRKKIRLRARTLEIFKSSVKSENGEELGIVILLCDVSRLEKLEEMAKRREKFAAMGEMAVNIAHEIRNPLGSIELFASLIKKDLKSKKNRDRASHIIASVKNMDNKISNLLLFTRKQKPSMKKIYINDVLNEILKFSEQIAETENVTLTTKFGYLNPIVIGDVEMLKQVFLNLTLNALQAMPRGGNLYIETKVYNRDNDEEIIDPSIEIRFVDTGIGIPERYIKKIFDPFFTTKEFGTGLGLAIVHNIIDLHGGSIDVESDEKKGTAFNITLPCTLPINPHETL